MRTSSQIVFNADGGGAGGAAAAAASGGDQAAAAAAAAAPANLAEAAAAAAPANVQAAAADPDAWFPKGLDAKWKGKDAGETLNKVAEHLAGQPKPPAEAKAYEFKPADTLAPYLGRAADSAVIDVAKEIALKHGLTQPQFDGFINGFYATAIEKGLLDAPVDVAGEFAKLGGTAGDAAARIEAGQKRVLAVVDGLNALVTRKEFTADEAGALKGVLGDAGAVLAIEKLLGKLAGAGPANGAGSGGQAETGTEHERALRRMYPSMIAS